MSVRGLEQIRRIRRRFERQALILLYHRVADISPDPQLLCTSPQHFAEHLEVLRSRGGLLPLDRLDRALLTRGSPRRTIALTFDDGYADSLQEAKPALERYDAPATVFVTTGFMEGARELWWDELERLVLSPGTLPQHLHMHVNGTPIHWDLGEAARYSEEDHRRHRGWNVLTTDDPGPRHSLYRALYQLLRWLPDGERRTVLDALSAAADAEGGVRPPHRGLSPDELVQLTSNGQIDVGAHTVTHPVLSRLPAVAQSAEIRQSKARLEEILGRPVTSFAYPYGGRSDYTHETVTLVREAGFARACANVAGVASPGSDRFQLPRFLVRDWDGDEFARHLQEWIRG